MPYIFVNVLLEVDDLLSWIVDEVTVTVEKAEAKDSMFSFCYFSDIGIQ